MEEPNLFVSYKSEEERIREFMDRVKRSWPSIYVKINAMLQGLAKTREEREDSMSQETKRMVF